MRDPAQHPQSPDFGYPESIEAIPTHSLRLDLMRNLIIVIILGGAFLLAVASFVDDKIDGKTVLAVVLIAIAGFLWAGRDRS